MKAYKFLVELRKHNSEDTYKKTITMNSTHLTGAVRKIYQEYNVERIVAILES